MKLINTAVTAVKVSWN